MRIYIVLLFLCLVGSSTAQELYIFTEPASNMPAKSLSLKYSGRFQKGVHSQQLEQRHTGEIMLGASKNLMVHAGTTFSDMYTSSLNWESVRAYAKYRFLSSDDLYKHFRMAAFGEVAFSKYDRIYDEISLDGDLSGLQAGVIATQLLHKLAVSTTLSYTRSLDQSRNDPYWKEIFPYHSFNYSLSAGYLVFPKDYVDYKQTNVNLYVELLGQKTLDKNRYYLDLAPGIQFIFNSQAKLNIGYRAQLNTNMHRMTKNSGLISFEWLFLNALK
jgi:hypothetical protein